VRRAKRQKPDVHLRALPLGVIIPVLPELARVLLFHPDPIWTEGERDRCFCNKKPNKKMLACEDCHEWFHFDCVGMDQATAEAADHWQCGYCRSALNADGKREWSLLIPQGGRKRAKKAKPRADDASPKAQGLEIDGSDMVPLGPRSWAEVEVEVARSSKKINLARKAAKAAATRAVGAGGHHIVDEMIGGGVGPRKVTEALIDELDGAGIINLDNMPENDDGSDLEDDDEVQVPPATKVLYEQSLFRID
jgi:hypothetical protein